MPAIDLTQLATRESEQVEWKENVADIDHVIEALCAFANDLANLGGGYVVCGAREVADEHGFPRMVRSGLTSSRLREVENRVLARCREQVAPPLSPLVDELPADTDDRRVLVFTQPATAAAHTFRRGTEGARHFVRVGRSTIEARNGILLNLLVRKGALEPWDRRVCATATERNFDLLALRDVLNQMGVAVPEGRVEQFLTEDVSLSPFVPTLCVPETRTNVLRPRNFAILLFDRRVQRVIPGAFTLFSVYPGTDRSDLHAERHELAGFVIEQVRRLHPLLDAQVYTAFDKSDPNMPNALKYPQRALYEAMGNALAHRDYELPDPVRITAFADRVEFLSPGSLLQGVDAEAFARGSAPPKWRNQALAWFFNRLQLAQAEGQGIPTILRAMRSEGCPPPSFRADANGVVCVLPAHPRHVLQRATDEAEQAMARADLRRAAENIEIILDQFQEPERRTAIAPQRILDLAQSVAAESSMDPAVRLVAAAGKTKLTEGQLHHAADALFKGRAADALITLVADQFDLNPTWAWRPRLLALAGGLLLRSAVQMANSGGPIDMARMEPDRPNQDFDRAAEEATRPFINAASSASDPEIQSAARRGLNLIEHLARQKAMDRAPDHQPKA